jgi:hypothetical protein
MIVDFGSDFAAYFAAYFAEATKARKATTDRFLNGEDS